MPLRSIRSRGFEDSMRTILWMVTLALTMSAACRRGIDPPATSTPAPATARLIAIRAGVGLDRGTGLEWTNRDSDQSLNWIGADRYCHGLVAGEQRDWRLPEIAELEGLYDPRLDEPCGDRQCHLDPAIQLGGCYVWSATSRTPGDRFYFDFSAGNSFSPALSPGLVRRVIWVRSR